MNMIFAKQKCTMFYLYLSLLIVSGKKLGVFVGLIGLYAINTISLKPSMKKKSHYFHSISCKRMATMFFKCPKRYYPEKKNVSCTNANYSNIANEYNNNNKKNNMRESKRLFFESLFIQ